MHTVILKTAIPLALDPPCVGYVLEIEHCGDGRWLVRDAMGRPVGWMVTKKPTVRRPSGS